MTIEFSIAVAAFRKLIEDFEPAVSDANESDTRFAFIDRLLTECLGWPRAEIKTEVWEGGERSDYECGKPRRLIVEAKRASVAFSLPPRSPNSGLKLKLKSVMAFNDKVKDDVLQVHRYCQDRGVHVAVLCNGTQMVCFLSSRQDGSSPLDGDALVFDSLNVMLQSFSTLFECLSPTGIAQHRLDSILGEKSPGALPPKLATSCANYFEYKYSSTFQENLRNASSLVIEDIGGTIEVERDFLRACYCQSGPLSQYSLLGKNILASRYAALFSNGEASSRVEEINPRKANERLSERVLAEALARRPIVLLGDVGVGKTSFIKNLIHIQAPDQFGNAIFVYFDLGSHGALSVDTKDALLAEFENTLRINCGINIFDSQLMEDVYRQKLSEFDAGFIGQLRDSQPDLFQQKRIEFIQSLVADRSAHLKACLHAVAKKKKSQVIIVIDNADQRPFAVQQEAFLIANELASTWNALVFIALRPQTFHASKRSGTISAYPPKVFVIPPPKLEDAIEKRLAFARKIAEGKLPITKVQGLSLHVESLAIIIRALEASFIENKELNEFLVNVSGGNVRVAIELISKFLGNPNVESERIVKTISEGDKYIIPLHEFAKGGLLGDYSHFQEESSYAFNVFNVVYPDRKEHFLTPLILGYLGWDGTPRVNQDGFVGLESVYQEMQGIGFLPDQIIAQLKRLTQKKLIETPERRLLEDEPSELACKLPESYRITSLGQYHVKRWATDFAFMEAMCFDTPIFSERLRAELSPRVNDSSLSARYERATKFAEYLDEIWKELRPTPYFDWIQFKAVGQDSFKRVRKSLGYLN